MKLGLRDRACIVTGASGGIGRATALTLAREGAALVLVGRREQVLLEVAAACAEAGGRGEGGGGGGGRAARARRDSR